MGDHLKKVQAGSAFEPSAKAWNTFIDAAQAHRARHDTGADWLRLNRQLTIVPVKNNSGADRDRFAALALAAPIITPTDNEVEFQNRVTFCGNTPVDGDEGKFAVLLEPAPAGEIVLAAVAGVTVAWVNVNDADDTHADVQAGSHILQSATMGSALILWKESGTGVKWAIVHLGVAAAIEEASVIDAFLDVWIDITTDTDKTYVDTTHPDEMVDWRGRTIWLSVRVYDKDIAGGTPAEADDDIWDDEGGQVAEVKALVVGKTWDADEDEADIVLWVSGQTQLKLEKDTGRLYLFVCFGWRQQVRITVRGTKQKASTHASVPDIVI
ncbi:hypothetical protein ES705_12981 [subsurface metagenome]